MQIEMVSEIQLSLGPHFESRRQLSVPTFPQGFVRSALHDFVVCIWFLNFDFSEVTT